MYVGTTLRDRMRRKRNLVNKLGLIRKGLHALGRAARVAGKLYMNESKRLPLRKTYSEG